MKLPPLPLPGSFTEAQMRAYAEAAIEPYRAALRDAYEALSVYADPSFYFGCSFMFDRPTGGFDEDLSQTEEGHRPGKLARETIAALATPEVKPLTLAALPALGAPFGPGLFAGLTTKPDGTHCAVVLLADKPPKLLPWKKAVAWAEEFGAELPARPVAALLYANCKDQFDHDPSWHWTSEAIDGSFAWGQFFCNGFQFRNPKSYEGRARAVRLIPLAP